MTANPILLQKKYVRVIKLFSQQSSLTLREALTFFYHSNTYYLMSNGIADMHARSDKYLAEDSMTEFSARFPL